MSKNPDDYELDDEYDFSELPILPKGRFAPGRRAARNLIVIDRELLDAFPDDRAVNDALRSVLQIRQLVR